MTKGN